MAKGEIRDKDDESEGIGRYHERKGVVDIDEAPSAKVLADRRTKFCEVCSARSGRVRIESHRSSGVAP